MAKKRKTQKRRTTRRRRGGIGSISPSNMLVSIGGVLAGVAAAGYLNKLALANQSENVKALVPVGLGIALPLVMKNDLGKNIGSGMIAYGGASFLRKAGLGDLGEGQSEEIVMAGDDLSVIAGDEDFTMAGDEDFAMAGDDISVLAGIDNA